MKIFFSVGEPSGDIHGANLIRQLRARHSGFEFVGYGGPRMARAGCQLHADLTALAIMWFARALWNLRRFLQLLRSADQYFCEHRPAAVVLIDYPGFNWWIARCAKKHDIPVFYYGVPQIWAWATWRVHKLRRLVDHALCKLPFEESWLRERGCRAVYVGHPFFDETRSHQLDQSCVDGLRQAGGRVIALLPGSRTQEVKSNLPCMLKAARRIRQCLPEARFVVASFNATQAALARKLAAQCDTPVEVYAGKTPEIIRAADCCIACSGSVSLELLDNEKPTVILYRVSPLHYFAQGFLRQVKYITLVNLLAAYDFFGGDLKAFSPQGPTLPSVPFPEYLTWRDESSRIAADVVGWLSDAARREAKLAQLRELKQRYARAGASAAAADYIADQLGVKGMRRSAA